jgi:hypothetical protein
MIKLINMADELMQLRQAGNLTVAANADATSVPFNGWLIGVMASVGTAGVGTSAVIDILQNETSIYGATKLVLAAAAKQPAYQPLTTDPLPVSLGDVFTLKVTTAFGTTPSVDLAVQLLFRRKNSPPAASYQGNFQTEVGGEE